MGAMIRVTSSFGFLEFFDDALPDTVEAREESTAQVLITPKIVSSFGVNHG